MNIRQETKKPGDIDPSFAQDGLLIFPQDFESPSIRVRNDGKILSLGRLEGALAFMRYLPDGALDESFGEGGIKFLPDTVEGGSIEIAPDNSAYVLRSLVLDSEGLIELVKTLPEGDLDTNFGQDGVCQLKISEFYDSIQDIIFQPDGKVVVLVRSPDRPVFPNFEDYYLVRIDNGHLDGSFGQNASGIALVGRDLSCMKAVQLSDGRFVIASLNQEGGLRLYRCTANGLLDPDFGEGGVVTIPVENTTIVNPAYMNVRPDDLILIAGDVMYGPGDSHTLTARITADGVADPGFNGGKPNVIRFPNGGSQNLFVHYQPDGKTVTIGATTGPIDICHVILMRFLDSGFMDPTFGNLGIATHDWGGIDVPYYTRYQSGKGLVVGGLVIGGPPDRSRLCTRYLL